MKKAEALVLIVELFAGYSLDEPGDLFEVAKDMATLIEELTKASYKKGLQVGAQNATIAAGDAAIADGFIADPDGPGIESDDDDDDDDDDDISAEEAGDLIEAAAKS